MAKYVAVNALSIPHPHNPKRTLLVHAGDVFEAPDKDFDVEGALESKAIRELTDDERANDPEAGDQLDPEAAPDGGEGEPVELPDRPGNGASTETWRNYLTALEQATQDVLGTLEVPEDAKRDDMILIGDARVHEYEEETE